MNKLFAEAMQKEGQTIFLQWVRAIIALAMVGITCWREFHSEDISETFAMMIGLVIGLYFEKGSMVMTAPSSPAQDEEPPTAKKGPE